jgi:copper chaperone CopZ
MPNSRMNMKQTLFTMFLCAGVVTATPAADKTSAAANATNYFSITGMHCDGCANGLAAELKETRGVIRAEVTFSNKLATVAVDTNKISVGKLTKVIKEAGFEAKETKP